MRRYLLFTWPRFYPSGGFWDFTGSYNTEREAIDAAIAAHVTPKKNRDCCPDEYGMVIDTETWVMPDDVMDLAALAKRGRPRNKVGRGGLTA